MFVYIFVLKAENMEKILVSPSDAVRLLCVSTYRFIRLQSSNKLNPLIVEGRLFYDLHEIKKAVGEDETPPELKDGEYLSVLATLRLLGVCRKTFYDRVKSGDIKLRKVGRRSYVKKSDLFAGDGLF